MIAVGLGPLDEEGNKKPLFLARWSIVMYSNCAGNDFKGKDGYDYITLRVLDVWLFACSLPSVGDHSNIILEVPRSNHKE